MKRIVVFLLACMIAAGSVSAGMAAVEVNEANFPDSTFRQYIIDKFDVNKDNILSNNEILAAKEINLYGSNTLGNIESFQGIKYLTSLETLNLGETYGYGYVHYGYYTELDLSGLTSLKTVSCSGVYYRNAPLTTLNVSGCTSLQSLGCSNQSITSLNISGCTSLQALYCGKNKLTERVCIAGNIILRRQCTHRSRPQFMSGSYRNRVLQQQADFPQRQELSESAILTRLQQPSYRP